MTDSPRQPRRQSQHFFTRDNDGSARIRIRFDPEEVALFEEACGTTPIMDWLHETLWEAASAQVETLREARAHISPPS